MKIKTIHTLAALLLMISFLFFTTPASLAQNTFSSYTLMNQEDGNYSYTLNVDVPPFLNEYYAGLSHRSYTDNDFPKFVTPYSVQPIANTLRQIYPEDEDFTNGILSIVHQIPYEETAEQFYPVETLLRNKGDCDMFSLLAASIMIAGGLDVVLLHYSSDQHMNVGVHLAEDPLDARQDIYSIKKGDAEYYIAECTGKNWRVGECPQDLQDASPVVVSLNNSEQIAPGQVSASFKNLTPTTIDFSVSSAIVLEGSAVTIEGQLLPAMPDQNVTLYSSASGSDWTVLATTKTQSEGKFTYLWQSLRMGEIKLRAGWTGNDKFAGTTSQSKTTFFLPLYLIALSAAVIFIIVLCVVIIAVNGRRPKLQPSESEFVSEV